MHMKFTASCKTVVQTKAQTTTVGDRGEDVENFPKVPK